MQIMAGLVEHLSPSFNMAFLDPPFFEWHDRVMKGVDAKERYGQGGKPDHSKLSVLALKLLKPNGVVWLCGTQPQLIEDYHYWSRFFRVVFELIQYKHSGTPPINQWQPIRTHENIWCMIRENAKISETHLDLSKVTRKGKKVTAKKEGDRMKIRYGKTWVEWRSDVGYPKSVWECVQIKQGSREYVGHPTQKPRRLIELIIKMSTDEGDWILDPFAGSGTTLIEAEVNNRRCLAIEIKREYCEMIKVRSRALKQISKLSQFIQ